MTIIASGTSQTFTAAVRGQTFTVTTNTGVLGGITGAAGTHNFGPYPRRRTFGPLEAGDVVTITSSLGDVVVEFGDESPGAATPNQSPTTPTPSALTVTGFGDSLTAYWNYFITPTSAVRSNGFTTINLTGHGLSSGTRVRVFGFRLDTSFNVADAVISRVDANNFTYANPGPDATATVDANFTRIIPKSWFSNVSPFQYANSALKGALVLVDNLGQSTEQTSDMLARLSEACATTASVVVYLGGSNDASGTAAAAAMTAAATIANDTTIVNSLLSAGKTVVLCTIPPLGTGHAAFATATPKIIQINAARRALAQASGGKVRLCDYYAALVNPATGGAKTNTLQSDNVHWQTYGARLAGVELAAALTGTPQGRFLTTSIADARATYSTSPNLWPVGQFTQTDLGTKSGPTNAASPPGGSVAGVLAGYNITSTSGAGEVWMAPDADGYGFGQVTSWTPSGAATVTIQQQSAATMAAFVLPGEVYRLGFHLKVVGVTSALTFLRCRVQGIFDGTTLVFGTPMHSVVGAASNVFTDFDEYLVGPEMVIPPFASCTSLTVEVIANFSGATTIHTITVSRMTLNKIR